MSVTSYSTRSDLNLPEELLAQLTDNSGAPGVADESLITQSGVVSFGRINDLLGGIYVVPFDPVPPLINEIDVALRRRWLFRRRPTMEMPAEIKSEIKEALDLLDKLTDHESGVEISTALRAAPKTRPVAGDQVVPHVRSIFGRHKDGLGE